MTAPSSNEKIIINFGWQGPSSWREESSIGDLQTRAGVIDLVFKNAKTDIRVHIPEDISPLQVQKLPFTCQKNDASITHPDLLKVTIEQIRNLAIVARISKKVPQGWTYNLRLVKCEMPEELEIGQTYNLVVISDNSSLSARLLKKESNRSTADDEPEIRAAQ